MADIAGPLLVRAGLITQAQLVLAQTGRSRSGGTVSEHLVAQGALDEEQLCNFYRQRLLVPRVGMAELARIAPHVIRRVPADMAAEFRIIPYEVDRDQSLVIAMAEPSDTHAIDEIGFFTGCFVMRAVAPASAIAWALGHFYGVESPFRGAPPAAPMPAERSGAVIVDRPPPLEVRAASVIVADDAYATPDEMRQAAKRQQAVIIDDVYGEDTPLPKPVPFDTTGQMVKVELPPSLEAFVAAPAAEAVPTAISDEPSARTIPNQVPPMPRPGSSPPPPVATAAGASTQPAAPPVAAKPPLRAPPEPAPVRGPNPDFTSAVDTERALAVALERLQFASDRDGIAIALVSYLSIMCRRAALFVVRKGALCGWVGKGEGVHPDDLRSAALALDVPSTFRDVVNTRLPFRGPVTDSRSRDLLIDALGWAPDDIIALPITLRDKVVSVLYGDGFLVQVPDEHLARVAREASEGLERALALRKGG